MEAIQISKNLITFALQNQVSTLLETLFQREYPRRIDRSPQEALRPQSEHPEINFEVDPKSRNMMQLISQQLM